MHPTAQAVGGRKWTGAPRGRRKRNSHRMTNDEKQNGGLVQIKTRKDVCPGAKDKLSLASVREKIDAAIAHDKAEKTGPEYWRSLEELAGSPQFQEALHREFPKG